VQVYEYEILYHFLNFKIYLIMKKQATIILILFLFLNVSFFSCTPEKQPPPNILFIAVDDLRPELNCFGARQIHSPNIDKLASEGVAFQNAYCQVPVCGASRASLLTGIRPKRERFIDYNTWAEKDAPGILTLPGHFKNNGYTTISNGKVFHHWDDNVQSWCEEPWRPSKIKKGVVSYVYNYQDLDNREYARKLGRGYASFYEAMNVPDYYYYDGRTAEKSVLDMRRLNAEGKPFFLAVGFLRPHLPFNTPAQYYQMYRDSDLVIADNPHAPENAPRQAMHNSGELRMYNNIPPEGALNDSLNRLMVHGYYASVSFTDAQVGKLLDELERLNLDKNTIVILWGDHGWNLGEHGLWCKHCLFETSLRAPIIIKAPGVEGDISSKALVEFVDIYPTLCELAGLSLPGHLQGESMVPYLNDSELSGKEFVFSRWIAGESVKDERYRYSEWLDDDGNIQARMLYDHATDPKENKNIVNEPELQQKVNELSDELARIRAIQ